MNALDASCTREVPLYSLPIFSTRPRVTRFCNFSYARNRSISSPPLTALRNFKFANTRSNKSLKPKIFFSARTFTNSSVT